MIEQIKMKIIRQAQVRNLMLLIGAITVSLTLLYYLLRQQPAPQKETEKTMAPFASVINQDDTGNFLLEKTLKQLREAQKKTDDLQQQISTFKQASTQETQEKEKSQDELLGRVALLEKQLAGATLNNFSSGQRNFFTTQESQYKDTVAEQKIREDQLVPPVVENHTLLQKTIANYVPAGTFAQAVMIGGADASAAVNAQANPSPMLFRIIADGTLPNRQHSHLKDCVVTAAVVGDISSERGLIRLESISCVMPDKTVLDQAVEGTIFGPEGKNGVRGFPVWREGALLQRAFAAGVFSGLSEGLSQSYAINAISAQGNVQAIDSAKIFQNGAAKGVGKAMDKLADYHIQRAEQYHPVIQLSAGTIVDVVFLKGFYLNKPSQSEDTAFLSTPKNTIFNQEVK